MKNFSSIILYDFLQPMQRATIQLTYYTTEAAKAAGCGLYTVKSGQ
jgi:hypothetical protein